MIIDASVAFKWVVREEDSQAALDLIGNERLIAPILMIAEVGNALWKKALREQSDANASFSVQIESVRRIVDLSNESGFIADALDIARRLKHPIYDCIYLAMAMRLDDVVHTADRKFVEKLERSPYAGRVRLLEASS